MILYFSGTGNSRYLAHFLAKEIDDEVVSINDYLKYQKKAIFYSEKPYVFVTPTYAWQMPEVIKEWIERASFSGNKKAYAILSCGDSVGQADYFVKRLFQKKTQLQFMGLQAVVMPENYIILFQATKPKKAIELIQEATHTMKSIAPYILEERPFPLLQHYFGSLMQSTVINYSFRHVIVNDKGFYASDQCVSCRICQQVCAFNNIDIVQERPVWKGHCQHCMACISFCPVNAIEYKNLTKNKERYHMLNEYENIK